MHRPEMEALNIYDLIKERFPGKVLEISDRKPEPFAVVEPAAIVCDYSVVGEESLVRAGALVKQRARFPARAVLEGHPAIQVGALDGPPGIPGWALRRADLATLSRRR